MAVTASAKHEHWSSRTAFIFAAVGSAVGLGNIWKFPYEAGQGGGGAFVLIYLVFVFGIGVPVMIAELMVGRRGQLSPPNAMKKLAEESRQSKAWTSVGWLGVSGAFLVLSFYSVIAGWTLTYIVEILSGNLAGADAASSNATFNELLGNPWRMTIWHAAFMALTVFIVANGIKGGLERAVTLLMPLLFVLLVIIVIYSLWAGDAVAALKFLFEPDLSELTPEVAIQALGQAFFSLSLALGTIMAYGAYLSREISIPRSAVIIASADTGVALLAGLAIFPIVFQFGLEPGSGPGLIFVTLPIAFAQMPGGVVVGTAFFLLLAVAALTSSISLLEPIVSRLEEQKGFRRAPSAIGAGLAVFLVGILTVLSFNHMADVKFLAGTVFDNVDFLTNNIIMPLGGLLLAIFVGWYMTRSLVRDELWSISDRVFDIWHKGISLVAPFALIAIFFSVSGSEEAVLRIVEYAGWGVSGDRFERLLHATIVIAVLILPTLLAAQRHHPRLGLLFFVNIVAGWTPIGWLFCLVWAHRPDLLPQLKAAIAGDGAKDG